MLNNENYFSDENNMKYCSVSQYKNFFGTPAKEGCEYRAMQELNGLYVPEKSDALLLGTYIDLALTEPHNLDKFKSETPELFSTRGATKGELLSKYKVADKMVESAKSDAKFMRYLEGEKQVVMTGTIFGVDFKIKIDNYIPHKAIIDLKSCEDMYKGYFDTDRRKYVSFIEYFDYLLQGAIYQEIVYQNTGERLPFYLACVSKEAVPNKEIIYLDDDSLKEKIYGNDFGDGGIANNLERLRLIKSGEITPAKCGHCEPCRMAKKITKPIDWRSLIV